MKKQAPAWIIGVSIACVLLGAWFRFSHLATKYYSDDEMYSSLYVAGYSMNELSSFSPNRLVTAGEFVRLFQAPGPRSALDTIRVLANWDPEHPPLYYLLERGFEAVLGDSDSARRLLAAIAGILLLPAVFWLCIELFDAPAPAWLAAALAAVSPFQVIYAQKVREYSLLELCTIVSATLLVRAFRKPSPLAWTLYAIALTLTLYSALFSLFVLLAFVVFAVARSRRAGERGTLPAFGIGTGAAFVAFIPWLFALESHWKYASHTNGWFAVPLPLKLYAAKVVFGITSVFFDAEYLHIRLILVLVPVCVAAAYALWLFARRAPFEGKALVWSLIGTTVLAIVCTDALFHASRATQQRYLIVPLLALEIAVAYGCAAAAARRAGSSGWLAPVLVAVLAAGGAFSCWIGDAQRSWWANNEADSLAAAARSVETDPGAIVVTTPYWGIQFANVAGPGVRLAFDLPAVHERGATLYLLSPSQRTLDQVRARERTAGEQVNLTTGEPGALRSIHLQDAQAHGRSVAFITTLWRF